MAPTFRGDTVFGEQLAALRIGIEEHAVRAEFALFVSRVIAGFAGHFNVVERLGGR